MTPNAKAWLASAGIALPVSWAMQALVVTAPTILPGDTGLPDAVLVVAPFLLMIVATILLRRAGDMRRRFGWGLSATGIGVLLGTVFTLLDAGLPEMLSRGEGGRAGTAVMLLMLLALPFMLAGAAMTVVGMTLLRRTRAAPGAARSNPPRTGDR